jgi:deaminated glutathione amidase
MHSVQPYKALALQTACDAVNHCTAAAAKEQMLRSLQRIGGQVQASKAFIGQDLQLVVLPEYFLSGFPMGESMAEWQDKGCIQQGDNIYQSIAALAVSAQVYLSGNVYELDSHFPGLYFQASFIISPQGETILRYRRLNSMFAPTPHDVLDDYRRIYGKESLFPVAQTPIGNLACIASEEILYPEIARCLALRGAEVLLHSSSEVGSTMLTQKNVAKLARATENMVYVVSANSASITGTSIPSASTDGHSQIVQYEGIKLCEAGFGESMVAHATLHLDALRHHRRRPGMSNFLARQRLELFADTYNQTIYPANTLANGPANRSHFVQQQQAVIAALQASDIIR